MSQNSAKDVVGRTRPAAHELQTDWAVHPGEILHRYMQEHGIRQADLAERTGLTAKHVNQIVKKSVGITPDVAVLLETALGTPHRFWSQLGANWDMHISEQKAPATSQETTAWANAFDVSTLLRCGVITRNDSMVERARKVLRFFGVASPAAFKATWLQPRTSFKRSQAYTVHEQNTALWLRLVERAATDLNVEADYKPARLRKAASLLPALTTMPLVTGFEAAQAALADAGVALVFVRQVPGTRVSAATWWLDDGPAIGITERGRRFDIFWWSILHEIGHLLLHPKRETFLDLERGKGDTAETEKEREADEYATEVMFPKTAQLRIAGLKTKTELTLLAAELNLGVPVVAGQHAYLTKDWKTFGSLRATFSEGEVDELERLSAVRDN
jgi:HTH-type transcriptional regulator/antitoxin HigA